MIPHPPWCRAIDDPEVCADGGGADHFSDRAPGLGELRDEYGSALVYLMRIDDPGAVGPVSVNVGDRVASPLYRMTPSVALALAAELVAAVRLAGGVASDEPALAELHAALLAAAAHAEANTRA